MNRGSRSSEPTSLRPPRSEDRRIRRNRPASSADQAVGLSRRVSCQFDSGCGYSRPAAIAVLAWLATVVLGGFGGPFCRPSSQAVAQETAGGDAGSSGVSLPSDRLRERQFDQAQRLLDGGRLADAARLLDEMLAADEDVFLDAAPAEGQTRRSMKTRVAELIGGLPPAGRDAYLLQFRSRAERALAAGIAADDLEAIVAVARRWLHTPAGGRAAIVVANTLLEAGQPRAAAAWLDRLDAGSLKVLPEAVQSGVVLMRAAAAMASDVAAPQAAAGKLPPEVLLGGDRLPLAGSLDSPAVALRLRGAMVAGIGLAPADARDWLTDRGPPGRNPICRCDRPLLVPRYRVPLTLHPQESQLLSERRQLLRDQGLPILPAGGPLAVGDFIVAESRAGLLAVDFASGKRVWMQGQLAESALVDTAADGDDDLPHPLDRLFADATSSRLASDGRLVFAVESPPTARASGRRPRLGRRQAVTTSTSNRLVAYDIAAAGQLAWELPRDADEADGRWYLGSPLPVGGELFVLVEERQQIRLDVLSASSGETLWSQPLADIDLDHDIQNRGDRRQAGLSPAYAGGIVVCPTGGGAVIAVDVAARTLSWAYRFPVPEPADVRQLANGIRLRLRVLAGGVAGVREDAGGGVGQRLSRWLDAAPIVVAGRVLLTPLGLDELHCIDLRTGQLRWKRPRGQCVMVAGVVGRSVILLGQREALAVSLDDGEPLWEEPTSFSEEQVCGRPLLTDSRLFVPLTTPAVAEVDVATGTLLGSSPGRGESLPGNLVAHRGEIISQGVDFLDVFHQTVPLDRAVETAMAADPEDPWAIAWRGQLQLAAGETQAGLEAISRVHGPAGPRPAAGVVGRAVRHALRHDFAAASPWWQAGAAAADTPAVRDDILRQAVAGFLAANDPAEAWKACQAMLVTPVAAGGDGERLVGDPGDPQLLISQNRWLRRQLDRLSQLEPVGEQARPIAAEIAAAAEQAVATAADSVDLPTRITLLEQTAERFGGLPGGRAAVTELAAAIDEEAASAAAVAGQKLRLQRDLLDLIRDPAAASGRPAAAADPAVDAAWPAGGVDVTDLSPADRGGGLVQNRIPVPLFHTEASAFPAATLETDGSSLLVLDRYGRPIGGSIPLVESAAGQRRQLVRITGSQPNQALMIGRVLLLATADDLAVFEVSGDEADDHRLLWTANNPLATAAERHRIAAVESPLERLLRPLGPRPLGLRQNHHQLQVQRTPVFRIGMPRLTGVPIITDRTLELRDLRTGRLLWRRRQIPAQAEAFGDDELLCVAAPDGAESLVLSMADGRLLSRLDLPPRDRRLAVSGRRLLAIDAVVDGQPRIDLISLDVGDGSRNEVAGCQGTDRAAGGPPGMFFTLTAAGRLTAIDVAAGRVVFATELPEPPAGLSQLRVLPWQDRYLVLVGRAETAAEQARFAAIRSIGRFGSNRPSLVESSLIYAVDRLSGDMLWARPASVQRQILHRPQPAGLPVLLFARELHLERDSRQRPDGHRHGLLCLDKRSGGLLHLDDGIVIEPRHAAATAELRMSGEPETSAVRLRIESRQRGGTGAREIVIRFTGLPAAEAARPFRGEDRDLVYTDLISEVRYWIWRMVESIAEQILSIFD